MFEGHHRFIGWLGLAVCILSSILFSFQKSNTRQATWSFVILGNFYDISRGEWRVDANSLISTQELWFAVFMTVLCVYPSRIYLYAHTHT